MRNYVIGALGGLLLASGMVWAIRHESTRAQETIRTTVKEDLPDGLARLPGKVLKELKDEISGAVKRAPSGPDDRGGRTGGAKPDTAGGAPGSPVRDVFDIFHEATKTIDGVAQEAFGLSTAEEIELGRILHEAELRKAPVIDSPQVRASLDALAAPLLEARTRKDVSYTFTVIQSPEINAYSLPGGYIYLNSGLIDFTQNDDELQFVLGHELGHVDMQHCAELYTYRLRAAQAAGADIGQIVQMMHQVIALGYSEDKEFACDAFSFCCMSKLGKSREQIISFPQRFAEYLNQKRGEKAAAGGGAGAQVAREVDNHFRSHPAPSERVARLNAMTCR